MNDHNFAFDFNQLPNNMSSFLQFCGKLAQDLNLKVFIVGGFVRDMLLKRPSLDLDLVIEGNTLAFANGLVQKTGGKANYFKKYLTAKVECKFEGQLLHIDLATARKERYAFPGAKPEVSVADIRSDLFRRDFSINAMAMSLDCDRSGYLLDPFDGRKAVNEGLVDILHEESCLDDPVRCFRAVRFEQRYGFTITDKTLASIQRACASTAFEVMPRARIHFEFQHLFEEPKRCACLARIHQLGLFQAIKFNASLDSQRLNRLATLDALLNFLDKYPSLSSLSHWQAFVGCLSFGLDGQMAKANLCALGVPLGEQGKLFERHDLTAKKFEQVHEGRILYKIRPENFDHLHMLLADASNESLVNLLIFSDDSAIKANILLYLVLRNKLKINMDDCLFNKFLPDPDGQIKKLALTAFWRAEKGYIG